MLIPYLARNNPRAAMDLCEKAFNSTTSMVMDEPDQSAMHAEMQIAGQRIVLNGATEG